MKTMKNIILRTFAIFALALVGLNASAQTKISGTVKDSKGEPVIGAVVMLNGSSSVGSVTDIDGKYSITLPASTKSPKLKASCIGYVENMVEVGGRSVIDFVLEDEATELDEVVVVGYGSLRKSDLTGSVTSVKIDEGNAARSTSIDQLLQGHAAGVQVLSQGGSPDAGVSIRIRGLSSFNGSTEPLYVIDGVIMDTSQGGESLLSAGLDNSGGGEETNGLMGINPQDIASMEILKDASATAIYGALGANGVVLITTKAATKDRPSVSFSGGVDVMKNYAKAPILDFEEFCDYLFAKKELGTGSSPDTYLNRIYADPNDRSTLKVTPLDWQDYTLRTAIGQRYHFTISGRPKSIAYTFSLGYIDKQGIVKKTGAKQYTARLNLDKTVNKKLKFGTKTSFAYIDSDQTQGTGGTRFTNATSLIRSMRSYRPYTTENLDAEDDDEPEEDLRSGPNRWLNKNHFINTRQEYRITPSVYLDYKIIPSLSFRSQLGGDYRNREQQKYKSSYINTTTEGTNGAAGTYENFSWNWSNQFTYLKKLDNHNINFVVGSEAKKGLSTSQVIQGWNIDQYMGRMAALNAAPNTSVGYGESCSQTLSFFGRLNYTFKERYSLTATYRADGSSKFKGSNKWAYFPSIGFAWRVTQEPWFNIKDVSMAKVRLGWGQVGNQSVSNYQTMSNFGSTSIPSHDTGNAALVIKGLYPSNLSNPDLKWETTEQVNVGLDLGLWKGRFTLAVDAYDKITYDLLQSKEIPTSSGFSTISVNEGTIRNRGLEFTLEATPVKTRDFEWGLTGNLSFNRNKIIKISETAGTKSIWVSTDKCEELVYFEGSSIGGSNYVAQTANIFMEGYPMGLFYGYKVRKVLGVGELGVPLTNGGDPGVAGQFDYYDLNQNGYIDEEDRTIIGDPNPDFTYGFGTTLDYKRFSLQVNFIGSQGNDIFNSNLATETDTYSSSRNIIRDAYYKAWTPENQDTRYPALGMIRTNDFKKFSDFYVEDGSYLRLSNVSLSYALPLKNSKIVKNINFSASLGNLWVWTKYSGWDPDVNSFGTNIKKMGVDQSSYPSCRTASFDLKFTF